MIFVAATLFVVSSIVRFAARSQDLIGQQLLDPNVGLPLVGGRISPALPRWRWAGSSWSGGGSWRRRRAVTSSGRSWPRERRLPSP